jgi:uncharacterized protein YbjT (DUF2867 family)
MSNLLAGADGVRQADALFLPAAGAKIAMIDPATSRRWPRPCSPGDGHDGRRYVLTGPEAVTVDEVAEQLSTVLGRRIGFVPVPDGAAVAQLVAAGVPEWYAANVVAQFGVLREGAQSGVQDVVRVLTGRDPRSVGAFLRDHAGAFAR